MKKLFLLVSILMILPFIVHAQSVEITPIGGYIFPSTMSGGGDNIHFNGAAQYGGIISIAASRVMDIELIYNRSDTKANVNSYYWNRFVTNVPVSINYMQIGFTKNFRVNPMVSPFLGFNLGGVLFYPKTDASEAWFFSAGMSGGAKVYFSKRVGLRLQAQMFLPIQGAGFYMFGGSGGAGGGVSVYSSMVQFGFTGGLVFRLGHVRG